MKKIKVLAILLLIILIILFLVITNISKIREFTFSAKKMIYEELLNQEIIDVATGEINNSFFNIDETGKKECTKGINEAIQYAKSNNIEYIKLKQGNYLINGDKIFGENKGILLESNMTFDLNQSTIKQQDSKETHYSIFDIDGKQNVTLINGNIQGERYTHDYDTINSTHQWGMGIEIKNSSNVKITNLNIKSTTGDAIYISEKAENIDINNCRLEDCRRQGISIIEGKNINIYENEIYNIQGQAPQSGIDLESNFDTQLIENVNIFENIFYSFGNNIAIQLYRYINDVSIKDNIIYGRIICYNVNEKLDIIQNEIYDGGLETDNKYRINTINLLNNHFTRSKVKLDEDIENVVDEGNNYIE